MTTLTNQQQSHDSFGEHATLPLPDSSEVPWNKAGSATIGFLRSDRPDAPRAGDAYGDHAITGLAGS